MRDSSLQGKKKNPIFAFAGFVLRHVNLLLLAEGILIIIFYNHILGVLHWVVGSTTVVLGAVGLVCACFSKKPHPKREVKFVTSFVLTVVGIIIMVQRENSAATIGIIWGLIGLVKGGSKFCDFAAAVRDKDYLEAAPDFLQSAAEVALSIALLYNPYENIGVHIIILGAELVILSFRTFAFKVRARGRMSAVAEKMTDVNDKLAEVLQRKSDAAAEVASDYAEADDYGEEAIEGEVIG